MRKLTSEGERVITDLSAQYGLSTDAVFTLLEALRQGHGTMAQFSHPELGGRGQWMAGGMTMLGDMSAPALQAKVIALAAELSARLAVSRLYEPVPGPAHPAGPTFWWPGELGQPAASGSQGNTRYAVFPQARRIAVQGGGEPVRVYDTLSHVIGGVQQQQGKPPGTVSFTSQHGTFTVDSLPPAQLATSAQPAPGPVGADAAPPPGATSPTARSPERPSPAANDADAVLTALERLGHLHERGILTDEEFTAKKAELLSRL